VVLVFVILAAMFRSVWSGLLGTAPTTLVLLVVYGGMSLLDVRLDMGTSLLAGLIVGAGVDFAMHMLATWRAAPGEPVDVAARASALHTGEAVWTNAITVAAGFFVLTLGEARPLRNVGGLTAVAMIAAALGTFVVVPVLARRRAYGDWQVAPAPAPEAVPAAVPVEE
jgi:uncharacterized protein